MCSCHNPRTVIFSIHHLFKTIGMV